MGLDGPGWRSADQAQSPEDTAATYRKARCWLLSIRSYPPVRALSILRRSRDAYHRHQRRISRADPGNGGRRNGAHQCHEPAHGTGDASLARIPSARERGWRSSSRSEEHTSELQLLMRISSAVFCMKKKKIKQTT